LKKDRVDAVEIAQKQRHLMLLERVKSNQALSKKELKELEQLEEMSKKDKKTKPAKNGKSHIASEHVIDTQKEAARYAGVNPRTVRRWVEAGMPKTEDGKYIRQMLDIYKANEGSKASEHKDKKIEAEADYKNIKAKLAQLELDEKAGVLISRDESQRGIVRKIIAVKRALLGQGRKLAPILAMKDERKIKKIIDKENREIIAAFAGQS